MLNTSGLFIGYASCHEERRYCESPGPIGDIISKSNNPRVQDAVCEVEKRLKITLQNELVQCNLLDRAGYPTGVEARSVQRALHIAACELISEQYHYEYISGYSSGYGVAYVIARIIDVIHLDMSILRSVKPHILANMASWKSGELASFLVYQKGDPSAYNHALSVIASVQGDICVKDNRSPYAAQIVGSYTEVSQLRSEIIALFPSSEITTTPLIKSDSAHMRPDAYAGILRDLQSLNYEEASVSIVGHASDLLMGTKDADKHGRFLFENFVGHLNMGRVVSRIQQYGIPLIAVSSPRVAKFSFYSFAHAFENSALYHWEDILLSSCPSPMSLTNRVPAW